MTNQLSFKDIKEIEEKKVEIQNFLETSNVEIAENFNFGSLDFDDMTPKEIEKQRNKVLSYFDQIPWFRWLWLAIIEKIREEDRITDMQKANIYTESEKNELFELFEWNNYIKWEDTREMYKIKKIFPWWIKEFLDITVDGLSKLEKPQYPKELTGSLLLNITNKWLNHLAPRRNTDFIKYLWYKLAEQWCKLTFINDHSFLGGSRSFWWIAVQIENNNKSKKVMIEASASPFNFEI